MAQVLVVVALAVVLEARAIAKSWDSSVPTWWRFVQGAIWVAPLIAIALILPSTLRATRPGAVVGSDLDTWCETLLNVSLGIVILGPALDLLRRASAWPIAVLLTLGLSHRWQLRRLEWQVRAARKSMVKLLRTGTGMEADNARNRARAEFYRKQVEHILAGDFDTEKQQSARMYLAELEEWFTKNDSWLAKSPMREGPERVREVATTFQSISDLRESLRLIRLKRRMLWAAALGSSAPAAKTDPALSTEPPSRKGTVQFHARRARHSARR